MNSPDRLLRAAISGPLASPLSRNSHALVVDGIGRGIVSGDFPPGSLLPGDADLALRFGVSRTVLREATKTLTAKGMLVARARVGTRVTERTEWNLFDADVLRWTFETGLDRTLLDQIREMRLAFEPAAARLAAEHTTEEDVRAIEEAARRMRPEASNEDFTLADLAFHRTILAASGNPFMLSLGHLIGAALTISFTLSTSADREGRRGTALAHRLIARAIAARDADAADAAMRRVIEEGRARIIGRLGPAE